MSASPPAGKDAEVEQNEKTEKPEDMSKLESGQKDTQYNDLDVREQDRWLPIANVARIMKTALPENAKIAKEAKECMQECVSEFISFITSEASEKCQQEKRKTVNGEDILFAMTSLGFENYAEALKIYLAKYRETASARNENHNRQNNGFGPGGEGSSGGAGQVPSNGNSGENMLPPIMDQQGQDASNPYGGVSYGEAPHNGGGGEGY